MQTTPTHGARIVLHDHLDGGVRTATLSVLARERGVVLPTYDPGDLATLIARQADAGSLDGYLTAFAYTSEVLQDRDALERVAAEAVEDLAADGVTYAEIRFAPELHTAQGLTLDEVLEVVCRGFNDAAAGRNITVRVICSAIRTGRCAEAVFAAAARHQDRGVVGVDLAGAETPGSVERHAAALAGAVRDGLAVTIHAGEVLGVDSIDAALRAGARRIGHGVRVVDDIVSGCTGSGAAGYGAVARRLLEECVHLEICPGSNVHTGVVPALGAHPVDLLYRAGFSCSVQPDNRLMSSTTASLEVRRCRDVFGWDEAVLARFETMALDAAFCDETTRRSIAARLGA